MNYKFKKRPVVIEAFQMTKERRQSNQDWPEWLHHAWNKPWGEVGAVKGEDYPQSKGDDRLMIYTLEGKMSVEWDDWIIQGIHGELYPCKPDIFEKTYDELVEKDYETIKRS
jgi:hypothetical protein